MITSNARSPYLLGFLIVIFLLFPCKNTQAERLKDITSIAGVRDNQLVGYGLVVGLNGTGDKTSQTPFTTQAFRNMLNEFGIRLPEGTDPKLKNVAAVSIHAVLPPFSRPGQQIDITVSSIGNSSSLRGGSLLMAPLRGVDGRVYAMAQGNLVVGGLGVEGSDGSRVTINIPSVGRIPNGATVERAVPSGFHVGEHLTLQLNRPDFTTAKRIVERLNDFLGAGTAEALDAGAVKVMAPSAPGQRVEFMAVLENLEVDPGEADARVVINSRTGTIVIGKHVRVEAAAVTHGNLVVSISENNQVSQPAPFGEGETVVVPQTDINVEQQDSRMFKFAPGVTLDELVQAVNNVGAAPGDLMAILEALKEAGALKADLVVI